MVENAGVKFANRCGLLSSKKANLPVKGILSGCETVLKMALMSGLETCFCGMVLKIRCNVVHVLAHILP